MKRGRGWDLIHGLDRLEDEAWRTYWSGYADRLTPAEAKRIRHESYNVLWRPEQPDWGGRWIEVTPKLKILMDEPELRRGKWRCRIERVVDDRPPHSESVRGRSTFQPLDDVTTLHGAEGREGDPEGVRREHLDQYSREAKVKSMEQKREEWAEQEAQRDVAALKGELTQLMKRAVKLRMDPVQALAPIAAEIQRQQQAISDAQDDAA